MENKELDLIDLIKLMWSSFKKFCMGCLNAVLWIIRFSIKHYIIIGLSLLVAVGASIYFTLPQNRTYNVDTTVKLNVLGCYSISDIILSLKTPSEDRVGALSSNLGIDKSLAARITKIQTFYVIGHPRIQEPYYVDFEGNFERKEKDTITARLSERLYVRVVVKQPVIDDAQLIQDGLALFVKNNEYAKKELEVRNAGIMEQIKVLDEEIKSVDELRQYEYAKDGQISFRIDKTIILGERRTYYEDVIKLQKKKEELTNDLILKSEAVLIDSPAKIEVRNGTLKIYGNLLGFMYVCGFVLSLLIEYRKKIIEALKQPV